MAYTKEELLEFDDMVRFNHGITSNSYSLAVNPDQERANYQKAMLLDSRDPGTSKAQSRASVHRSIF